MRRVALVAKQIVAAEVAAAPVLTNSVLAAPKSELGATRFVQVNGHQFFVVINGNGERGTLLCMPGALGTAETDFPLQMSGLAETYRVVSFDPRGYGKSRPPKRDWPIDFYQRDAEDAHAIMQALGYTTFSIVGWSDGGNSGVHLAAMYPKSVEKLVIFGSNAWVDQNDIDMYELTRDVHKNWSKRMLAVHVALYGDDLQPLWDGFCDTMKAIVASGGDICKEQARQVKCPTLVLHGGADPLVPACHPEWFRNNIPDARLHIWPEGKHNIHVKYASEFNKLVLAFLAESHNS
eukprot:TRINITY_DN45682_c0_g1_i1.p1 TRINITY_DN45682_c0_g1~~TRINITY_DN45682_c0_g1_i1.p1  ORF type:complete len:292 (+),score=35.01 TRINITY_DN45682_c0_g1_i1:440-1315(+)